MLKKLAYVNLGLTVVALLPFLNRDVRTGFKWGWNDTIDRLQEYDIAVPRGARKFKNV